MTDRIKKRGVRARKNTGQRVYVNPEKLPEFEPEGFEPPEPTSELTTRAPAR
jgi:hypothetical protein